MCVLPEIDVALRVITAPNSAFAHIRDSGDRYFMWSVGIFVLATVLWSFMFAAPTPANEYHITVAQFVGIDLLGGTVFVAVIYLMGRQFGGNGTWKTVFSVLFYTYVLSLLGFVFFAAMLLLAGGTSVWEDLVAVGQWDVENMEQTRVMVDTLAGMVGYLVVLAIGALAFLIWVIVVLVKAVKTVNGFGTAKALGIIIIALLVSSFVAAPLSM